MTPIIDPVDRELLKKELTKETFLRKTNNANNEIYILNAQTGPNVLREIGRLREISFRSVDGGSGKDCDLDHFDLEDKACYQLIVWDPEHEEIVGGYRFTRWAEASFHENGQPWVNTEHLFDFSEKFLKEYFPYCIEMARAFVQPKYQGREMGRKSLFALDNIWDGIGGLVATSPDVKYLAGKVTVYKSSPEKSRKAILYYLHKFYGDKEGLLTSKRPETYTPQEVEEYERLFSADTAKENYKILNTYVKSFGDAIPPLIHSYIELSSSLKTFGTTFDPDFGDVYDTAMMITLADVYEPKRQRYIESYFQK